MKLEVPPNVHMDHKHRKFVHPIHRLPIETLAEIFLLVVEDQEPYRATIIRPNNCLAETPLIFGSICNLWRAVAWGFPRLWTTLSFPIQSSPNINAFYAVVQGWLQRTGALPLKIHISCYSGPTDSLNPLIDLLKEYSNRWHHLELYLAHPFFLKLLLDGSHVTRTSCLDILEINPLYPLDPSPDPESTTLDTTMAHSPRILQCGIELSRTIIQWHLLEQVDFQHVVSVSHLFRFLHDAPRVTRCNVNGLEFQRDQILPLDYSQPPLFHHHLENLRIVVGPDPEEDWEEQVSILEKLFSCLALPSLKSLEIGLSPTPFNAAYADVLIMLVSNSACSLQVFRQSGALFTSDDEEDQLLRFLLLTPTLERLGIESYWEKESCICDHFFGRLSAVEGDPNLLPNLKAFEYSGPRNFSWESLVKIWSKNGARNCMGRGENVVENVVLDLLHEPIDGEVGPGRVLELDDGIWEKIEISVQYSRD